MYILVAVKRCYENLRRTHREQCEDKVEHVEHQAKRRSTDHVEKGYVTSYYNYTNIYILYNDFSD